MTEHVTISPELQRRVAAIAERTGLTSTEIIADALENGHSLEWQERFLAKVGAGIAAADRGNFASPEDVERVRRKYRPS